MTLPFPSPLSYTDLIKPDLLPKTLVYKTRGAEKLVLHLYSADGAEAGSLKPAAVWFHGGAWKAGQALDFFPQARYFASQGLVGVSVGYRLLGSQVQELSQVIADCKSALRYLRAHAKELGIDPRKIAALGDSAGGHLVACLALETQSNHPDDELTISPAPDLLIICNGVLDLTKAPWIETVTKAANVGSSVKDGLPTQTDVEKAKSYSPLHLIGPLMPPSLILQGEDDLIVEPQQAKNFAEKMTESGNDCQLQLLRGAKHAFIVPRYKASEPDWVRHMILIDDYLASRGYASGTPTLTVSRPAAWDPVT